MGKHWNKVSWSTEEDCILRNNYGQMSVEHLTRFLPGRIRRNLVYRARKLGLGNRYKRHYTQEEDKAIIVAYKDNIGFRNGWMNKLAEQLSRSLASIYWRGKKLGAMSDYSRKFTKGSEPFKNHTHSTKTRLLLSKVRSGIGFSKDHKMKLSQKAVMRLRNNPLPSYHRGKSGKREDLNNVFFRSAWEANYARFLNWQGTYWEYEVKTFWFEKIKRGSRSYTPDFWIPNQNEYHEVKGWMDQKSRTKLSRMTKYYPGVRIIIIDGNFFRDIERKRLCRVIPRWECGHKYDR